MSRKVTRASYGVYDKEALQFVLRRVDYDIKPALDPKKRKAKSGMKNRSKSLTPIFNKSLRQPGEHFRPDEGSSEALFKMSMKGVLLSGSSFYQCSDSLAGLGDGYGFAFGKPTFNLGKMKSQIPNAGGFHD